MELDKIKFSDLILCPYNYLFDQNISKKMNFELENSIIIIEEAHNFTDHISETYSKHLDLDLLNKLIEELQEYIIFIKDFNDDINKNNKDNNNQNNNQINSSIDDDNKLDIEDKENIDFINRLILEEKNEDENGANGMENINTEKVENNNDNSNKIIIDSDNDNQLNVIENKKTKKRKKSRKKSNKIICDSDHENEKSSDDAGQNNKKKKRKYKNRSKDKKKLNKSNELSKSVQEMIKEKLKDIDINNLEYEIKVLEDIAKNIVQTDLKLLYPKYPESKERGNEISSISFFDIFKKLFNDDINNFIDFDFENDLFKKDKKGFKSHTNLLIKVKELLDLRNMNYSNIESYLDYIEFVNILYKKYNKFKYDETLNKMDNIMNSFLFYIDDKHHEINKSIKTKSFNKIFKKLKRILHIYCMDANYVFKKLKEKNPRTIIMTSGTLAPFNYLESELKTKININLEGNHIINPDNINFSIICNSIDDVKIKFKIDFTNKKNQTLITHLGKTIAKLIKKTTKGVLLFFPSYSLLEDF